MSRAHLNPRYYLLATALASLAACSGKEVEPPAPQPTPSSPCPQSGVIAEGENDPYFIAAGATQLFWRTRDGIRSAPISGGSPSDISGLSTVRAIAAHGDDLFVADYGAFVIHRIRDGQSSVLAQANANALAVAGEYLYWAQQSADNVVHLDAKEGTIARVSLQGGPVEVLIDQLECPQDLAVNARALFFTKSCSPASVARWVFATGVSDSVHTGSVSNIAAMEQGAYFIPTDAWPPALVFAPSEGQPAVLVPSLPSPGGVVAADASGVYIGSESGRVSRLPPGETELETLATDLDPQGGIGAMTLAEGAVFATLPSAGKIVCVPKSPQHGAPPVDGPCPDPLGDPLEIAATPRANRDMELLALRLDDGITATQDTYDRLVADAAAIEEALPGVAVQCFPRNDGQSLQLNTTEPAGLAIQADTYTAWDCLNDFYGVEEIDVSHSQLVDDWWINLRLKGLYDTERLSQVYALLPGVLQVTPSFPVGDGPTTCVSRSSGEYEYVIDDRGGDCPAGCTETTAYYFVSSSAGAVVHVDTWDGYPHDPAAPEWYALCEGY